MKKFIVRAVFLIAVVTAFAGFKLTECDFCRDNTICQNEEVSGETLYICRDCLEETRECSINLLLLNK